MTSIVFKIPQKIPQGFSAVCGTYSAIFSEILRWCDSAVAYCLSDVVLPHYRTAPPLLNICSFFLDRGVYLELISGGAVAYLSGHKHWEVIIIKVFVN